MPKQSQKWSEVQYPLSFIITIDIDFGTIAENFGRISLTWCVYFTVVILCSSEHWNWEQPSSLSPESNRKYFLITFINIRNLFVFSSLNFSFLYRFDHIFAFQYFWTAWLSMTIALSTFLSAYVWTDKNQK